MYCSLSFINIVAFYDEMFACMQKVPSLLFVNFYLYFRTMQLCLAKSSFWDYDDKLALNPVYNSNSELMKIYFLKRPSWKSNSFRVSGYAFILIV